MPTDLADPVPVETGPDERLDARPVAHEVAFVAGAVLVTRLLLLLVVGALTHGREFTDDAPMLMGLARHPFEILSGITANYGQHPPFLGVLEAIVALPARAVLPDFYALRVAFAIWESIGAGFAWLALRALIPDVRVRRWAGVALVVLPIGWMTSVVMVQDEVIAATWVAAVVWLLATKRASAALVVAGAGVVAGKIFLGVPLLVLVLLLRVGSLVRRAALAFGPIVVVYGWVVTAALARGNDVPLLGFDPDAKFGVNLWVLLGVDAKTSRRISEVLVLAAVLGVIGVFARSGLERTPRAVTAVVAATLLWTYVAFYHVNPEYYVLLLVPVLVLARRRIEWVGVALLFSIPWAVNVFYGIDNPTSHTGEKARISKLITPYLAGGPHLWFLVSVWACIVVTLGAALWTAAQALGVSLPSAPGSRSSRPASHSIDSR